MDLNQLRTYNVLGRTKNFSKCAKILRVSQSAVSQSIKKLEDSLGFILVERKANNFRLTVEGDILFQMCLRIFSDIEQTKQRLVDRHDIPEVIRFGTRVEFGVSTLIKKMAGFNDCHPEIHIDYTINNELLDLLLNDELDLIIDCKNHTFRELKKIELFREDYSVIASPVYIDQNNLKTTQDLKRCNILSIDKELTWWHNFIYALPANEKIDFQKVTKIDHVRGIINAAIESQGVGFVPRYAVMSELSSEVLVSLFPDIPFLEDTFNIYLKRKNLDNPTLNLIIEYIDQHLETWVSGS